MLCNDSILQKLLDDTSFAMQDINVVGACSPLRIYFLPAPELHCLTSGEDISGATLLDYPLHPNSETWLPQPGSQSVVTPTLCRPCRFFYFHVPFWYLRWSSQTDLNSSLWFDEPIHSAPLANAAQMAYWKLLVWHCLVQQTSLVFRSGSSSYIRCFDLLICSPATRA